MAKNERQSEDQPDEVAEIEEEAESKPEAKLVKVKPNELEVKAKKKRRRLLIAGGVAVVLLLIGGLGWKLQWYASVTNWYYRASIVLKIKEGDKFAVEGATLELAGKTFTSDANGRITADGLRAGAYTAHIRKDGYEDKDEPITLKKGENDTKIISLVKLPEKLYSVKGYVQDAVSGLPLVDVQVTLNDKSVSSDPAGQFSFSRLAPASLKLSFSKKGYADQDQAYTLVDSDLTAQKVELVPNGQVIFVSNRNGKRALYKVGYDGATVTPLMSSPTDGEDFAPSLSPDNNWVVFASDRDKIKDAYGSDLARLYMIGTDSKNGRKISDDVAAGFSPLWAPGGQRFYYFGYSSPKMDQGVHRIYDVPTSRVYDIGEEASNLVFSPDGSTVAYEVTSTEDRPVTSSLTEQSASTSPAASPTPSVTINRVTVYLVKSFNVTNGERHIVAKRDQYVSELRFNSAGTAVSYDTVLDNVRKRFESPLAGGEAHEVGLLAFSKRQYTVSPNGNWKAFIEERDGKRDLYIVDKDEKNERQLSTVGVVNEAVVPSWDASSHYITFAIKREAENALYVSAIDGKEPKKITDYFEASSH